MAVDWTYYDYPTNYSNNSVIEGPADFFLNYPAFITNNISLNGLMIFMFFGLLILGLPFGMGASLIGASYIMFILSTYLWYSGAIDLILPLVFLAVSIGTTALVAQTKK